MTNSKRPVNAPDDLKGLKMRTMENPVHIQAYKAFGIIPTPMAFTEVFTALQQGTVDGQENPLSVITAAKFDQVQKYLTLTGHVYSPALILMNKAQCDKLSAADKQAFVEAAKEAVKANRARIDEDESKAVADLRSKGMTVVENVDKAKFQAALGADVRRVRQEVRPGQHRQDPQLQVDRLCARSGARAMRSASSRFERARRRRSRCAGACAMLVVAALPRACTRSCRASCSQQPAEWSEVLIRFTLIWMVFLGAPVAFRQGAMVSVDVLYRMAGPRCKRVLDGSSRSRALVLIGVMIWCGCRLRVARRASRRSAASSRSR